MKRAFTRTGLVVLAYAAAFLFAYVTMRVRIAFTSGPDRQQASGMFAFGDDLYFIAVFVLASIPATALGFYYLRPYPLFWRIAATLALCVSATGIGALLCYFFFRDADTSTYLGMFASLSPLRVLAAPLLAVIFVLSLLFAPTKRIRIVFLSAATTEVIIFVWIAFLWFRQSR